MTATPQDRSVGVDAATRLKIEHKLAAIESEHDVRILYACESGSRAWGFASDDSDYDVRFIYCHGLPHYLSVGSRRDVIEQPVDDLLDLSGWDLRKALQLGGKSNPSLLEWLRSPIVYRDHPEFMRDFVPLMERCCSPATLFQHYASLARHTVKAHLGGPRIRQKKYFYVLRPLLACRWIERKGTIPPIEFAALLPLLPASTGLRQAVDNLLTRKKAGGELMETPPIEVIHAFANEALSACEARAATLPQTAPPMDALDNFFYRWLMDAAGRPR